MAHLLFRAAWVCRFRMLDGETPVNLKHTISRERLMALVSYDADSGIFTYRHRIGGPPNWNVKNAGRVAGRVDRFGYCIVGLDKHRWLAHRLAWLYHYGVWPTALLDHIDRNRTNNAIENLREASPTQNRANRKPAGSSGRLGVTWHRRCQKWQASCGAVYLGMFDDLEEAAAAYNSAAIVRYGEFAACMGGAQP